MAHHLRSCGLSVAPVVDHLLQAVPTHLTRELRWVLLRAADQFLTQHATECGQAHDLDVISSQVAEAFDAAAPAGNLEATIAALVGAGIDAERICWDVISRESVKHEGLIHKECNRLARSFPDRVPDELKGYGWAGLRTALRQYDPDLGYAFSTYACPKINGAIRDGVRAESPIPKRLTTFLRKVSSAEEALTHSLARVPTYDEIAEFVNSSAGHMRLLPRLAPAASIEELALSLDGERGRDPECLIDDADPQDEALTRLRNEALHAAVNGLPADEAEAVRLLLLEEVPVGKAAQMLGIEPRQLRQRKVRALKALEPVMRAWMDEHELTPA